MPRRAPVSFWRNLPGIFVYPFIGNGKHVTAVGAVLFSFISVSFTTPLAIAMAMVVLFYATASMAKIVEVSAFSAGAEPPDWPGMTRWSEWFGTVFIFVAAVAFCYAPALAYFFYALETDTVFWVLFGVGVYITPMCVLVACLIERTSALNFFILIESIAKTFIAYTVTAGLWVLFLCAHYAAGLTPFMSIPIFGRLLKWFVFTYFLFVNMRLLGIFYRAYSNRLGWFEELSPQGARKPAPRQSPGNN